MFSAWKRAVKSLKSKVYTLYLAYRHPRTPWYAKFLAIITVAYGLCYSGASLVSPLSLSHTHTYIHHTVAVSPIDLIPDWIPVLGLLDDMILVPLGFILALHFVPREVVLECEQRATAHLQETNGRKAKSDPDLVQFGRMACIVVVILWLCVAVYAWKWIWDLLIMMPPIAA